MSNLNSILFCSIIIKGWNYISTFFIKTIRSNKWKKKAQANERYLKYMNEGRLRDILKVMGLMPDYTVMNDVLIMSQMPNVKLVKRLTGWNKDGRKVKEHQKSLKIISPCLKKYNQDYTDENGNVFTKGMKNLI